MTEQQQHHQPPAAQPTARLMEELRDLLFERYAAQGLDLTKVEVATNMIDGLPQPVGTSGVIIIRLAPTRGMLEQAAR